MAKNEPERIYKFRENAVGCSIGRDPQSPKAAEYRDGLMSSHDPHFIPTFTLDGHTPVGGYFFKPGDEYDDRHLTLKMKVEKGDEFLVNCASAEVARSLKVPQRNYVYYAVPADHPLHGKLKGFMGMQFVWQDITKEFQTLRQETGGARLTSMREKLELQKAAAAAETRATKAEDDMRILKAQMEQLKKESAHQVAVVAGGKSK